MENPRAHAGACIRVSAILAVFSGIVFGDVSVPAIISDHMVLAKAPGVSIWGEAEAQEEVVVTLDGMTAKTTAGPDGGWKVSLNLSSAKEGPFELKIEGKNRLIFKDVLVGEVWVAAGQSNMEFPLKFSSGADEEIAGSGNFRLRQFRVAANASGTPRRDCQGKWTVATPQTSGEFSGVAYYFSKNLQRELGVPVGVINVSLGGTPVEAWISEEGIDSAPELKASGDRFRSALKNSGMEASSPAKPPDPKFVAGYLFNGMINPVVPGAISGVIWYQGEFNVRRAVQYRTTFPLLISDWRRRWNRGDFPFYFCQLAGFLEKRSVPEESMWAELREAQSMALKLPNTGQAVLVDLGESGDIHPKNKKDVGDRLARIALAKCYGRNAAFCGPVCRSVEVARGEVRLSFDHADGGLVAWPLPAAYPVKTKIGETAPLVRNSPDSELEGFSVCGPEHIWIWANARIDGDSVVVWSDKIAQPVAVRYAWADNPTCNLFNGRGLPASPFRTDDEPLITRNARY